jgi:hypothetical protein
VLFRKARSEADKAEFKKTGLRIVTFNYDRSLEYYFLNCIKAAYGPSQDELLKCILIVHVYGQLGDLEDVPYGAWASAREPERLGLLDRAAGKISIVHEQPGAKDGFKKAQDLIEGADRTCVLGFGFDMTNVARLFPKSVLSRYPYYSGNDHKWIGGTTYGLSDQMLPILERHGLADFTFVHERKINWPPITIYEWLSNHEKGSIDW